jgi:hypothetical protein
MRKLIFVTLLAAGCGGPTGGGPLREPDDYTGCATDEHWRTFDDQAKFATVADATGPAVTAPQNGATIAFANKPLFTWSLSPTAPGTALGNVPMDCDGGPEWTTGAITTMHLPPITGIVYDLQFSSGGEIFYRVVTTLQEWLPPDTSNHSMIPAWAAFKGKQVTLKIWRMELVKNDLRPGTNAGPFVAMTPFTFTVGN